MRWHLWIRKITEALWYRKTWKAGRSLVVSAQAQGERVQAWTLVAWCGGRGRRALRITIVKRYPASDGSH